MDYRKNIQVLLAACIILFTTTISIPAENNSTIDLDSISKQVEDIFAGADELAAQRKQRSRDYLNSLPDEELAIVFAKATAPQQIPPSGISGLSKVALEKVKKDRPDVIEQLLKYGTPLSEQEGKDFRGKYVVFVDELAALGPAAVPAISLHTGEKYRITEHWALAKEALQKMGTNAVEPLIDLMDNPDEKLRENVVYVLYRLGDTRAKNAFLSALDDEYGAVRKYAVEGLKQLGPEAVGHDKLVAILIEHLEDSSCIRECIRGLERYGDETAVEPLGVIERFYPVREGMKKFDLRYHARQAINAILTRAGKPVQEVAREDYTQKDSSYDELCAAAQCPNAAVRSSAISWLERFRDDRTALFLIEKIKEEQNSTVLDQITRTLYYIIIPPKGSTEPVVSPQVMQKAFDAFLSFETIPELSTKYVGVRNPSDFLTPQERKLLTVMINGARSVLYAANEKMILLERIEQFKNTVRIWGLTSNDTDLKVTSYQAVTTIAIISPKTGEIWTLAEKKELQQELAPFLDVPNPNIRLIECLGHIGDKRLTPRLIELLGHSDASIRIFAANALGRIGDPQALPALEQLARNDPYQYENGVYDVREAARHAIEQINKNSRPAEIKDLIRNRKID